jgi:hypothetical protein
LEISDITVGLVVQGIQSHSPGFRMSNTERRGPGVNISKNNAPCYASAFGSSPGKDD